MLQPVSSQRANVGTQNRFGAPLPPALRPSIPGKEQRRGGEREERGRRQKTARSMPNNIIWMSRQRRPCCQAAELSENARLTGTYCTHTHTVICTLVYVTTCMVSLNKQSLDVASTQTSLGEALCKYFSPW